MKVVVFGATGVIGRAAAEHFGTHPDCEVVAVSRRAVDLPGVVHVPLDLADSDAASSTLRSPMFAGTTHVVFAALQESSDLVSGWRDIERDRAQRRPLPERARRPSPSRVRRACST